MPWMGNVITYHRMIAAAVILLLSIPPITIVTAADMYLTRQKKTSITAEPVLVSALPVPTAGLVENTIISTINNMRR